MIILSEDYIMMKLHKLENFLLASSKFGGVTEGSFCYTKPHMRELIVRWISSINTCKRNGADAKYLTLRDYLNNHNMSLVEFMVLSNKFYVWIRQK